MNCTHNDPPIVTVVIPSIGTQPLLGPLIDQLQRGTQVSLEIIVAHSGGPTPTNLAEYVTVAHSEQPLLASAARNRGANLAQGKYLFFVDDDNEVSPGMVDTLVALLEARSEIVEVGPAMYYASSRETIYCLGAMHDPTFGRTRWVRQPPDNRSHLIYSETLPNAFMVRRAEFEAIGGFDELAFPMAFEESDLAFRLRARFGGSLVCTLDARLWHHTPLRTRERLAAKGLSRSYLTSRNRPIFIARHLGIKPWIRYIAAGQFAVTLASLWGIACDRHSTPTSKVMLTFAHFRGTVDGVRFSTRELRRKQCDVADGSTPVGTPAP